MRGEEDDVGRRQDEPIQALARHFGLDATRDYARIMDKLAEERALACRSALSLGVAESQLLPVTFQGCTGEQKVDFIPRAEAPKGWAWAAAGSSRAMATTRTTTSSRLRRSTLVRTDWLLLPPATSRPPRVRVDVFMAEAGKEALYGSTVVALDSSLWAEDRMDLEGDHQGEGREAPGRRAAAPPSDRRRRQRQRSSAPSAAAPTSR